MKLLLKRIAVFALVVSVLVSFNTSNAASVGKIKNLSKWKRVIGNFGGDGVEYEMTWSKVKNATGYQVKYYEKGSPDEQWYIYTQNTKKTRATIAFSSMYAFKAKVRAYRIVNGRKKYGSWSSFRKKIVDL